MLEVVTDTVQRGCQRRAKVVYWRNKPEYFWPYLGEDAGFYLFEGYELGEYFVTCGSKEEYGVRMQRSIAE